MLVAASTIACSSESQQQAPTTAPAEPGVKLVPAGQTRNEPSEQPVITYSRWTGHTPRLHGAYSIWADGTVQFRGKDCKDPRYGTLPPERVTKLLDELEAKGWLQAVDAANPLGHKSNSGPHCESTTVTARRAGKEMWFEDEGCNSTPPRDLDNALRVIGNAIGPSPC